MIKRKFYYSKHSIDINNADIDQIMISNKISVDKKDLNTLLETKIILPQMSGYLKCFDEN